MFSRRITLFAITLLLLVSTPIATTLAESGADVVVMGATPRGLASALSAARSGRSATFVADNHHFGGTMTSGRGGCDIENRAMIRGLFAEFLGDDRRHSVKSYGADRENVKVGRDGFCIEPSVAESVFESLPQAESNVRVMKAAPVEILNLPGSGTDPAAIDFENLPRLKGDHAVINRVAYSPDYTPDQKLTMQAMRLNLHNYLVHHDGRFWCIWSDGPRIEDWPTQEVKYATSTDGLNWSEAKSVTGTPDDPYAFIARGLWVRDGQLLTLAAHYRGKGAFGVNKELELHAYGWNEEAGKWEFVSKVYDNAINNFPPQKLPTGEWILTRRDARFNVTILIGGKDRLDNWQAHHVVDLNEVEGFRPDEPIFWLMPDQSLNALFRDNAGSMRLFHATSRDLGKTWTTPAPTNFPNSTSKIFSIATSRGYRVMVSNANPQWDRRELHLSVSEDGKHFTRMARLDVPAPPAPKGFESIWKKFSYGIASLQYPHVIEHNGHLWIALSRCKLQTEIFRVSLDAVDLLRNRQ